MHAAKYHTLINHVVNDVDGKNSYLDHYLN